MESLFLIPHNPTARGKKKKKKKKKTPTFSSHFCWNSWADTCLFKSIDKLAYPYFVCARVWERKWVHKYHSQNLFKKKKKKRKGNVIVFMEHFYFFPSFLQHFWIILLLIQNSNVSSPVIISVVFFLHWIISTFNQLYIVITNRY